MNRPFPIPEHDPAPECRETLERLQRALDGEESLASVRGEPHLLTCRECRERVQAATFLTRPIEAPKFQPNVEAILAAIATDRPTPRRRRIAGVVGLVLAASVLLAIVLWPQSSPTEQQPQPVVKHELPPPETPRIDEAIANAGDAIQGLGRIITEPPLPSSDMIAPLAEVLAQAPMPPMAVDFQPVATSLAELPEAALNGLEPVTGSATRVFTRFVQDVSAIPASTSPKSKS